MAETFWQRLLGTGHQRPARHRPLGGEPLESRSLMSALHGIHAPWTRYRWPGGFSVTRTYDDHQRLTHEVANGDGVFDYIFSRSWTLDRLGRLVEADYAWDYDDDGVIDFGYSDRWTY